MVTSLMHVSAALLMALHGAECDFKTNPPRGDHGTAWGVLQIRPPVIADVNRIYHTRYRHADAEDPAKAFKICQLYLTYWGAQYQKKTGKVPTDEVLARIWNGGPVGWKARSTRKYWLARVLPHWGRTETS